MPSSAENASVTASRVFVQLSCYVPSTVLKEEREVNVYGKQFKRSAA